LDEKSDDVSLLVCAAVVARVAISKSWIFWKLHPYPKEVRPVVKRMTMILWI
jgi:hypothetical protein